MCLKKLMKFHHCMCKILKNIYALTKSISNYKGQYLLTELAPYPYFSIVNVHLVDINVLAKFDEILSMPVQYIKEKPKCHRWTNTRKDGWTDICADRRTT